MTDTLSRPRPAAASPRQRRRRWPAVLAVALVLALGGAMGYALWFTGMFAVTQLSVSGADEATEQQVRSALADEQGVPLVRIDTDALQIELTGIPEIASATVVREWPHGLLVTVTPRQAVAVTLANNEWYSLDAGGVPFRPVKAKPSGLVSVELATPGPQDASTPAAVTVVGQLPAAVKDKVATVRAPSPYRVELELTDKRMVIWGDTSAGEQKSLVLPVLLTRKGTIFDISDPTMVTVK